MTVSELNTLYATANTALDSGDYAAAITAALQAKMILATKPNVSRNLAGGGSQSLAWANAVAIDSFIAHVRHLQAASAHATHGPFQQIPITYARPDDVDAYS